MTGLTTPPADAANYPYARDLDTVWHRRPDGDEWTTFDKDRPDETEHQARTVCDRAISSVHVSTSYPAELDAYLGETMCPDCQAVIDCGQVTV